MYEYVKHKAVIEERHTRNINEVLHDANSVLEALLEDDRSSTPEELVLRDPLEFPQIDTAGSVGRIASHSVHLLRLCGCC